MTPEAGLGRCQPHSVEWLSSRIGAGDAVLLLDRSVERRSDCGHFGSVDWRACVRIKVLDHLCIKCPCDLVAWHGDMGQGCFLVKTGPRASRRCVRCWRGSSGET
jgi:hypothetical protein